MRAMNDTEPGGAARTGQGPGAALSAEPVVVRLRVNGEPRELRLDPRTTLLDALREHLGLKGSKKGCDHGQCGACTVHLDGRPVRSCITPVASIAGKTITTIEAIGKTASGEKIQKAWLNVEVVQCGYCQPGQIMSAAALIESNPNPSDADIDAAMSGNICRCGTYLRIRAAIKQASQSA